MSVNGGAKKGSDSLSPDGLRLDGTGNTQTLARNKRFMKSLRSGNVEVAKSVIEKESDNAILSYNDDSGTNALESVIESGSKEVLENIIKKCRNEKERNEILHHAMLFAIKANKLGIIEHLLDLRSKHLDTVSEEETEDNPKIVITDDEGEDLETVSPKLNGQKKTSTLTDVKKETLRPKYENPEFSSQITAVGLAAKLERCDALKLLLQDEELASELHPISGTCTRKRTGNCVQCKAHRDFKETRSLDDTLQSLEIYKALSSPAYLLHAKIHDPILETFKLSAEMERLQDEDPALKKEYQRISHKCRHFAKDLLALCRSTKEVETLLNCQEGSFKVDAVNHGGKLMYPRLSLALHFGQKEFVCHPFCQHQLQKKWCEGYPSWVCKRKLFPVLAFIYAIFLALTLPIWCVLYMFKVPFAEKLISTPVGKFTTHTISYMFFLILLLAQVAMNVDTIESEEKEELNEASAVEYLIALMVLGQTCSLISRIMINRKRFVNLRDVASSFWRFYDIVMLALFWIAIIGRLAAFIQDQVGKKKEGWDGWDRSKWGQGNPRLIAEITAAFGIVLAVLRINSLLIASNNLGPMQLSLKRMAIDIFRFVVLFFIVLSSFSMALTCLYNPYRDQVEVNSKGVPTQQKTKFTTFLKSYKTLFWAMYGYGEPDDAQLVVNNTRCSSKESDCSVNTEIHPFTELMGYSLYGLYHVVVIIVLLNMLIAMMAKSYDAIQADADNEWKFARTRLRMTYFNEMRTLPPPFNVFPVRWLINLIKNCRQTKCCRRERPFINNQHGFRDKKEQHDKLIQKLLMRYRNRRLALEKRGYHFNNVRDIHGDYEFGGYTDDYHHGFSSPPIYEGADFPGLVPKSYGKDLADTRC